MKINFQLITVNLLTFFCAGAATLVTNDTGKNLSTQLEELFANINKEIHQNTFKKEREDFFTKKLRCFFLQTIVDKDDSINSFNIISKGFGPLLKKIREEYSFITEEEYKKAKHSVGVAL